MPSNIDDKTGNILVGLVPLFLLLNAGPLVAVALGIVVADVPASICSHVYDNTSPALASAPVPVNAKAVDFGIVKFPPAFAVGVALPVVVTTAHDPPVVPFVYMVTCSILLV